MAKRSTPTPKSIRKWRTNCLNEMQLAAIDEFFKNGGNQRKALLTAGYSEKTATGCPHSVFQHPLVVMEIDRRRAAMMAEAEIDEAWVLKRLARLADAGLVLAPFRKVNEDGDIYWDFTGATQEELAVIQEMTAETYMDGRGDDAREVKKIKIGLPDAKAALDSITKLLGLNKEKPMDGTLTLTDRLIAGRKRAASKAE